VNAHGPRAPRATGDTRPEPFTRVRHRSLSDKSALSLLCGGILQETPEVAVDIACLCFIGLGKTPEDRGGVGHVLTCRVHDARVDLPCPPCGVECLIPQRAEPSRGPVVEAGHGPLAPAWPRAQPARTEIARPARVQSCDRCSDVSYRSATSRRWGSLEVASSSVTTTLHSQEGHTSSWSVPYAGVSSRRGSCRGPKNPSSER
jgi:hypothetical protein